MFLYGVGVIFFLGVCVVPTDCRTEHMRNDFQKGYPDPLPKKRSAQIFGSSVLMGMRALRNLLNSAIPVRSDSPIRQFIKSGGYERAFKDFWDAGPTNVQVFTTEMKTFGRTGDVGDKQLVLRYNGQDSYPTLEIRELRAVSGGRQATSRLSEAEPVRKPVVLAGKITDKISYPEFIPKGLYD